MDAALTALFQTEVEKSFAFLAVGYTFSAPHLEIDERIDFATITFKGQNLAVQLILDERAEDISCKVARVIGGDVTKNFARDENGALVRESLASMLRRKGTRGDLFTKVSGLSLVQRIPITVEDFARMLREHGENILADSISVFS